MTSFGALHARIWRQCHLSNHSLNWVNIRNALCKLADCPFTGQKSIKRLKRINKWPRKPNVCFLSFSLGLIYVIALQGRFRRGAVREPHMCISSSLITLGHLFVCANVEKGYSGYRYDHVVFSGFRYYHSIEYTKLDWLKASSYRSFKIQTSSLPRIHFLVCEETNTRNA